MSVRKFDIDANELEALWKNGQADRDIALLYGCTQRTIFSRRHELGFYRKKNEPKPKLYRCICGGRSKTPKHRECK